MHINVTVVLELNSRALLINAELIERNVINMNVFFLYIRNRNRLKLCTDVVNERVDSAVYTALSNLNLGAGTTN
jgi:hypothetical protein